MPLGEELQGSGGEGGRVEGPPITLGWAGVQPADVVTAASQYRLLVHALQEADECGRRVVPLLDAVVLAPDKATRDDALQASGRPCQQLIQLMVRVLEEGRLFLEEMGESPLELDGVRRALRAF